MVGQECGAMKVLESEPRQANSASFKSSQWAAQCPAGPPLLGRAESHRTRHQWTLINADARRGRCEIQGQESCQPMIRPATCGAAAACRLSSQFQVLRGSRCITYRTR